MTSNYNKMSSNLWSVKTVWIAYSKQYISVRIILIKFHSCTYATMQNGYLFGLASWRYQITNLVSSPNELNRPRWKVSSIYHYTSNMLSSCVLWIIQVSADLSLFPIVELNFSEQGTRKKVLNLKRQEKVWGKGCNWSWTVENGRKKPRAKKHTR